MDREVWQAIVHVVAKSQTRLSDLTTNKQTNKNNHLGYIGNEYQRCEVIWLWSYA